MRTSLNIACHGPIENLAKMFSIQFENNAQVFSFTNEAELQQLFENQDIDLIVIPRVDTTKSNFLGILLNENFPEPKVVFIGCKTNSEKEKLRKHGCKVFFADTQYDLDSLIHLIIQNRILAQLHEDAKRFAPRVVHEIRNPALIISGALENISAEAVKVNNPLLIEATHRAKYGIDRLNETLNTMMLLDVASDDYQRPKLTIKEIIEIIKSTAEDLIDQFPDCPPIGIQTKQISADLSVDFEPTQLRQIMLNLLKNAYQALADKSKIEIRVTLELTESSYLTISVIDNGPGIPETLRGKIFRSNFTTKKSKDSRGIGLALCRKIAHKNKAELMLDSDSENTKFDLLIPFSAA